MKNLVNVVVRVDRNGNIVVNEQDKAYAIQIDVSDKTMSVFVNCGNPYGIEEVVCDGAPCYKINCERPTAIAIMYTDCDGKSAPVKMVGIISYNTDTREFNKRQTAVKFVDDKDVVNAFEERGFVQLKWYDPRTINTVSSISKLGSWIDEWTGWSQV